MNEVLISALMVFLLAACGKEVNTTSTSETNANIDQPSAVSGSLNDRINRHGTIIVGTEGTYPLLLTMTTAVS